MIRAVVFDFNGVLVDDEAVHFALFREVLATRGISLSHRQYHDVYLGFDDRECFETVLRDAGQAFDRAEVDDMIARKGRRYFEVAETGLTLFPGAVELINTLANRCPLAICSGALRPEIEFALRQMGVTDKVAAIVSAEDTEHGKPDPEGYRLSLTALKKLPGLADLDASECLVFEDSLAGIIAAKNAGMKAVGVAQTYTEAELLKAGADGSVASLASINLDWIERTFRGAELTDRVEAVGLLLCRDLFFHAKVTGTASKLGHRVMVAGAEAKALELLAGSRPRVVFVDLASGDLTSPGAIRRYRQAAPEGTPFVAFGSHVDVELLAAAAAAGCDPVLPRSKFTNDLPALIRRYFAGP